MMGACPPGCSASLFCWHLGFGLPAGMVGAPCNNGIGVCGVNQAVKVMGCKFLDGSGNGYTSDAVRSGLQLSYHAPQSVTFHSVITSQIL